ncbi:MAG: ribonuclease R [Verrucomicrobiales bacterium]
MEDTLVKHLGHKRYTPSTVTELLGQLDLAPREQTRLQQSLRDLERRGLAVRIKGGRYLSVDSPSVVAGRIQITKAGRGFLTPEDPSIPEIAIRANETGTALNDDKVLVLRDQEPKKGFWGQAKAETEALSGTVVRIVERRRSRFVGTLRRSGKGLHVTPDDPRFSYDISVLPPKATALQAKVGDKVVVELGRWESRHTNPEGRIVEVLGAPSADGIDMLGVLRQYGLNREFPEHVVREARRFGHSVTAADLKGRRDCRKQLVVTIDPDDARDFDDAICLEKAGGNRWKLWVHIADVSHYVRPGSALDEEARRRGNSSYLVDQVIPMLPEELSNELCSLKPNVDRLTKCAEFLLAADGRVLSTDFYPAVIHSKKRLTYADALNILERAPGDEIGQMLHQAHALAQSIRKRRFENGSLDLDFPETKIRLDATGKVLRIEQHDNDISHQLIEEFMLLANEAVAGRLMKLKRAAIYRTHEAPDPDRLKGYREEVLGHSIPCGNLTKPAEVQKLFRHLGELAVGAALKIGFLKSLNRARYTVDPLGHYGLAKKKYAHFTSPIRRYADLVVHRSLFADAKNVPNTPLHDVADHLSSSERNSADAERDSKDVKLHAYLLDQIHSGKPVSYPARVTSLRDFGFFVDIAGLGMSGMVPLALLEDDHYRHDAVAKHIEGRGKRRTIRLGDTIQVEIAKVDAARKMVDFRITGTMRSSGRPSSGPRPGVRSRSRNHKPVTAVIDTADNTPKAAGEGASRRRRSGRRRGKAKAA